ncbi:MAG: organic hydroperoxide resistance protein, partial [Dongiaceae bacterium]
VKISDNTTVTATVGIGPRDDGKGFGIDVELAINVPGLERAAAEGLVQKAHIVCPYSHATKGNVDVRLKVV